MSDAPNSPLLARIAAAGQIAERAEAADGYPPLSDQLRTDLADGTGVMKVVFFNQPWLERRYRPGTRLALYGKYDGRNAFKVSSHSETVDVGGSVEGIAHYAVSEGITSTQLAELVVTAEARIASGTESGAPVTGVTAVAVTGVTHDSGRVRPGDESIDVRLVVDIVRRLDGMHHRGR